MKKLFTLFTALLVVCAVSAKKTPKAGENTFSAAVSSASAGEVIELDGTYTETSTFTLAKSLIITAAEGKTATIKPSDRMEIPDGVTIKFINVKFDGSALPSGDHALIYTKGTTGGNCLIFEGCELYGFGNASAAIQCRSSYTLDYILVNNCKFYNNNKSCIFLENTNTKLLRVTNSSFYNITSTGTFGAGIVDSRSTNGTLVVDHCTFYNCAVQSTDYGSVKASTTSASARIVVSNNIVWMPSSTASQRALHLQDGKEIKNCLTYNYTNDSNTGIRSGCIKTNCLLNTNPSIPDAATSDFTLGSTSPCRLAGSNGSHMGDPRWWPIGSNINVTIPAAGVMTYVAIHALDFSSISNLKAYVATSANASGVTMTEVGEVPAGTPLVLVGTAGTYNVPVIASASAPATNLLLAGDEYTVFNGSTYDYILFSDSKFYQIGSGTVAYDKAYLHLDSAPAGAAGMRMIFDTDNTTNIDNFGANEETLKFFQNGELFIKKNGVVYNALGQVVR